MKQLHIDKSTITDYKQLEHELNHFMALHHDCYVENLKVTSNEIILTANKSTCPESKQKPTKGQLKMLYQLLSIIGNTHLVNIDKIKTKYEAQLWLEKLPKLL